MSVCCALPVGWVGTAQAADAAPAAAPVPESTGNEIVVTATKREQTLQQVPVAVSVTTAAEIARAHVRDINDLSTLVPSLRVSEHQSSAQTDFLIRGFGNGANNAGIEPSVGVFIDGVYRSRSAAQISDFPDIRRVEVLRGPQSTLFGKNASAGVISVTTAEPQFKHGGSLEVSYGNYNALVIKSTMTGPLTDNLAFSLASGYNRRDGVVHDAGSGQDVNDRKRGFMRGQLLFAPADGPRVRLIADYSTIDENCCAVVNLLSSSTTSVIRAIGGKVNPTSDIYGDVYTNFGSINRIRDYGVSAQIDHTIAGVKVTSITAWRKNTNYNNQDSDFTSADLLSRNMADITDTTFTQELRLSAKLNDRASLLLGAYYFNEKISQTGQLLYGSQMRTYADQLIRGASSNTLNVALLEGTFGALEGNPTKYTNRFFASGTGLNKAYAMKDESISVFGQIDFKLTDRLTFTGGLNYTKDSKRFSTGTVSSDAFSGINLNAAAYAPLRYQLLYGGAVAAGMPTTTAAAYASANMNNAAVNPLAALRALQFMPPFLNVPNAVESGRVSDDNLSFTARLAYTVSPQLNMYASIATGFKAASINLSRDSRPALSDSAAIAAGGLATTNLRYVAGGGRYAQPEKSTVYELGLKGNWGLASVNIAAFYQQIKGFQSNIFTGTGFDLLNADKESVYGFEFEGQVRPTRELTLSQSLTYLVPKYDSFTNSSFGNVSGMTPAGIAPLSMTLAATWDHVLPNGHHVILRGDWHYESPVQIQDGLPGFLSAGVSAALNAARPYRRTVSQIDASLSWKLNNGLEFAVWGRNLTNDRYISVVFDSPAQQGSISGYVNTPRTYGVSALWKY
ncbi:TonB-dependent receptor [Novosphingobium sp. FSY-8]|uniref:TonB-dependent receptor n=1 Tax=Novosphingobium ovatum TaxID=1908523 RepID=A0ABW9XEE1_9SPHN|nr:TonB-dependent receptor [Novosphingobium ovatum]NBC36889.1 TonB-dependent receptor [Novosphingobium ovatum]